MTIPFISGNCNKILVEDNEQWTAQSPRNSLLQYVQRSLRIYFARFSLSIHRFLIERGRWMKPKIELPNRICTLCNDKDIQDEYHMVLKCVHLYTLRTKFINKYYYVRSSMYKFKQLMNTRKKGNIVD